MSTIAERLISASNAFLIAVLWFDLMFDVQVIRHRNASLLPTDVLDSIARYYKRVTTDAFPMGRLVAVAMLTLFVSLIVRAASEDATLLIDVLSIGATVVAVGLALARVVRDSVRLGAQTETQEVQTRLARGICRDHFICLAGMLVVFVTQLVR